MTISVDTSSNPAETAEVTLGASGTYYSTSSAVKNSVILSANGSGATLNLGSLSTINSYADHDYSNYYRARRINATSNGRIDLSGVTTIMGGKGDDLLLFQGTTGGTIDLSGLRQIEYGNVTFIGDINLSGLQQTASGTVSFDTDAAVLNLDYLTDAGTLTFALSTPGAVVNMPLLQTQSGGSYYVENGRVFNAGSLTNLAIAYVQISDPAAEFNTGGLANIDHTRFILSNGSTFDEITDTDYVITSSAIKNSTVMSADGTGTLLDASSITSIDNYVDHDYSNYYRARRINATSGGMIDLSGVSTIMGGKGDDLLFFQVTTGGTIDLSGLQQITAGNVQFVANSGGSFSFGDLNVTPAVQFDIDDTNTEVSFGHLSLASNANFAASGGAVIRVAGDFSLEMTDETRFDMDSGIMQCCGEPMQWMEVAGMDNGVDGGMTDNFALAQLIVGSDTDATDVVLVDLFDNGNRNGDTEALYLLGSGGLDGLQILGGSTLHIGNIPVYTLIDGQMTDLHDLFAPGETMIAYNEFGSNGFVSVPEPSTVMLLMLGFCSMVLLRANRRSKRIS